MSAIEIEVDGTNYEVVVASDLVRDGMALECWLEGEPNGLLLEAFWHDPTGTFTFQAFSGGSLPFALVEQFVELARHRLPSSRSEAGDGNA